MPSEAVLRSDIGINADTEMTTRAYAHGEFGTFWSASLNISGLTIDFGRANDDRGVIDAIDTMVQSLITLRQEVSALAAAECGTCGGYRSLPRHNPCRARNDRLFCDTADCHCFVAAS